MTVHHTASAVGLLLVGLAGPIAAQIDYRNLDDDRPVATEDAYPIERHAFELLVPYEVRREQGGEVVHAIPLELAYGVVDNGQLGVRTPFAVARDPSDDPDWGVGGLDLFALYNVNTESPRLPAFSLRADVQMPVGSLAGNATRAAVKAIATRSWGRTRIHLNALRGFGAEQDVGRAEPLPRWRYSLAVDRTLFRQSALLVGEVVTERAVAGAPVEVDVAAGVRWQWTPTLVLDLGVARRLGDTAGPDYAFTVGLSHAFALGWLMPAGIP